MNPTAKKIEQDLPVRKFEIKDNGDVVMDEVNHAVVTFPGREFLGFYRKHLQQQEQLTNELSEKIREAKEKLIGELGLQITEMKPIAEKVDKLMIELNKKQKREADLARLKEALESEHTLKPEQKGLQRYMRRSWPGS